MYIFYINELQKTSKLGRTRSKVSIHAYEDSSICPVKTIKCYLERTAEKRLSDQLFISFKTYQEVKSCTLSRWLKNVLSLSGIDVSVFKAHSFRGASSSAAVAAGVSVADVMKTANWSSVSTFRKFYHRDTVVDDEQDVYGTAVLGSAN